MIPPEVEEAAERVTRKEDLQRLGQICEAHPSPLSNLINTAREHLSWPRQENVDSIETRARHEVVKLERGIVVLEIVVGIAPLMGLMTLRLFFSGALGGAGVASGLNVLSEVFGTCS